MSVQKNREDEDSANLSETYRSDGGLSISGKTVDVPSGKNVH